MKNNLIEIPGSLNFYNGTSIKRYKKKDSKISVYRSEYKKIVLRLTSLDLIKKIFKVDKTKRRLTLRIYKNKDEYMIDLHRSKEGSVLNGYNKDAHPHLSIAANKFVPKELIKRFEKLNKKSFTLPVKIKIYPNEWKDIYLKLSDFLISIEKEAKFLLNHAIKNKFYSSEILKGRGYDLQLIGPNNVKFLIAVSTYGTKSNLLRKKEKIKQKILQDITKLLVYIYNKNIIPVIITRPLETEKTWSYTTSNYISFYKENFNFKFITTNFKKGWEKEVYKELLKLDRENKHVQFS